MRGFLILFIGAGMGISIETRNLSKRYGNLWALSNLDLTIEEGEVFGLIGPNGAGKTTLLRILSTLTRASRGSASICGYDVRRQELDVRKVIGFMPDFYALYNDLKVWEYLEYFAGLYEIPRSRRRMLCRDLLVQLNLGAKIESKVKEISRGMKQRLCLARALIHDPKVLLLDEPASGLDPQARLELRDMIKKLQSQGKTLIVSSHILSELSGFCSSFGLLEKGVLVKSGRLDDIEREQQLRTIFLEVVNDGEVVANIINGFPDFDILEKDGKKYVLSLQGEREQIAQLNRHLVQENVDILACYEKRITMEEIFQKYSNKEVS